jgi:hypothetical protein
VGGPGLSCEVRRRDAVIAHVAKEAAAARVWKEAAARVGRTPAPRGSRQQMSCNF